jgi:hypothetical protein
MRENLPASLDARVIAVLRTRIPSARFVRWEGARPVVTAESDKDKDQLRQMASCFFVEDPRKTV